MAELLLELFSEEIPARMQTRAADDLRRLLATVSRRRDSRWARRAPLRRRSGSRSSSRTCRSSPAVSEEEEGPRVGAPEQAMQGFLKGAGLKSIDGAQIVKDEKKGDFYVARINKPGRAADEIVNEVLRAIVVISPGRSDALRTTARCAGSGRCIRSCCLLNGKVVPFEIAGIQGRQGDARSSLPGNEPFKVTGFADYEKQLKQHKVVLDRIATAAI